MMWTNNDRRPDPFAWISALVLVGWFLAVCAYAS